MKVMSSVIKDSFISSFPVGAHFNSFSHLFALAKISSLMLKMIGERGHPCLSPDL